MSIKYRFSFDGSQVQEVGNIRGWDKFVTSLKRDSSGLKGFLITQDVEISFIGEMYKYVYDKLFNSGVCTEIDAHIEQSLDEGVNYSDFINGVIFMKDVKLSILDGVATSKITDDSFYSRIDNNQSIETVPDAGKSKNEIYITPAPVYDVDMFNPSDGTSAGTRKAYFVYDVMKYLVDFMSDGEVGFKSDLLSDDLLLMITNGEPVRNSPSVISSPNWNISFERLLTNLRGIRDISFGIEYDSNKRPILTLEHSSYFSQGDIADTFVDPTKIKAYVDSKSLYSSVRFGSNPTMSQFGSDGDPDVSFLEETKYNGFLEELFYILGQCNIDQELNLLKDIIVSSNVIEHILNQTGLGSPDTSYDNDLIFIHCESVDTGAHTAVATESNPSNNATPPLYYNMALINSETGKDYFTSFQGSLASFLNFTPNTFQATLLTHMIFTDTSTPAIPVATGVNPVTYQDFYFNYQSEIDTGNNFNIGTDTYTAPTTGYYTFSQQVYYNIQGLSNIALLNTAIYLRFGFDINGTQSIDLERKHCENNLSGACSDGGNGSYPNTHSGVDFSINVFLTAGDTVRAYGAFGAYNTNVPYFRVDKKTRFSATSTPDSGGVYQEYSQANIQKLLFEIEYPLSPRRFEAIANLERSTTNQNYKKKYAIYWAEKNKTFIGNIESLRYDHKSEKAAIILKSSVSSPETYQVKQPAYRFSFDMTAPTDEIFSMDYDSGASNVLIGSLLSQNISDIKSDINTAFAGAGITTDNIIVERQQISGALFHYIITIINPNFDFSLIDVSGNVHSATFIYI